MALLKRHTKTASRSPAVASDTARQLQARSKYLAHLAAAQGYRAAANSGSMLSQTRSYVRRHPMASVGVVASLAGLLGFGVYRRNKR